MAGPCLGVVMATGAAPEPTRTDIGSDRIGLPATAFRQAPPGVLAFGLPCGFGVPTVAAFTPCIPAVWPHRLYRQMHATRFDYWDTATTEEER